MSLGSLWRVTKSGEKNDPARALDTINQSRRRFIKQGAGLTLSFSLAGLGCERQTVLNSAQVGSQASYTPNFWVRISAEGKIRIYAPADELGQGSMTALPLIVAEEMDADWDDVEIEMSPTDEGVYGNPKFMNALYTISSISVTGYYETLRICGAQTRAVLLDNAAANWGVPVNELRTEPSLALHEKSGRHITYGEIASFASLPAILPVITTGQLKSPEQFRLIGHDVPRRDVVNKVLGTSTYSINEQLPDMVRAVAARSPVMGGSPVKVNTDTARSIKGVKDVIVREHSVCVVADNYFSALKGRQSLEIEWSSVGTVGEFDSEQAMKEHIALAQDAGTRGRVYFKKGEPEAELDNSGKVVSAEYQADYVYHAQVEPMNSTVWVKEDGSVEAWAGTQASGASVRAIARATGIAGEKITLHRSMVGGGFGRRSIQEMDYLEDAAGLSKHLGKPVKVIWGREDDFAAGWFKPMSAHHLRACINKKGRISAWHHRVAVQEPLATAEPLIFERLDEEPVVAMPGTAHESYDFQHQLAEHIDIQPGIRTYTVLGVGWTPNIFAVEAFMDELALLQGVDAVEYRLRHLPHAERARKVLLRVADMADWGKPRKDGQALGIAFADYHHTLVAGAAEISQDNGKIKVHEFWSAIDPGVAVQPGNIKDQVAGAVIFGLGNALMERITIKDGLVQQSNFHDYSVPKMGDTPAIHVDVRASGEHPTGVGQTAAVLVAPAISSAFYRLTGKRLRRMPFTPGRVLELLNQ